MKLVTQQFRCYPDADAATDGSHPWSMEVAPESYTSGTVLLQCPEHDAPVIAPTEGE